MHLAASFTMVTNHLHGPDRRAAAGGVGGPAWEGEWGGLALKGPVTAVGTRTMGPGPSGQPAGRISGARVAAGLTGAPDGARFKASEGSLEGASEAMRLSYSAQPLAVRSGNSDPATLQPQARRQMRSPGNHNPPAPPPHRRPPPR